MNRDKSKSHTSEVKKQSLDKSKSHTSEVKKQSLFLSKMKKKVDEYDTYGTHVANQLRQIEDRKKVASVRFKIDEIIFKAICETPSNNESFKENSSRSVKAGTSVEEPKQNK